MPTVTTPRVLVVSPRPARADGRGDQRRTHEIVTALATDFNVTALSWMSDVGAGDWRPAKRGDRWTRCRQLGVACVLATIMPAQVAYVQSLAPRSFPQLLEGYDLLLFVTDRVIPRRIPSSPVLVDFIDDLGDVAIRRGRAAPGPIGLFWRIEGRRMRRFDRRVAAAARLTVAHSSADAVGIHPSVRTVPLSVGTVPLPDTGDKVVFFGNLFYAPNHEAALWICTELVPQLARCGVPPERVVIAGRRPGPALIEAARRSGVKLRADLPDLFDRLLDAAVVLVPMVIGTGSIYKVLDASGAGRPCVISPVANAGLWLEDGESALVRERSPGPFADAVATLLGDPALRARLAACARMKVASYMPEEVAATWRGLVRTAIHDKNWSR